MITFLHKNRVLHCTLSISLFFIINNVNGQIRSSGAQYYENQYLGNPAFAGVYDGLHLNMNYQNQWRSIPGSPVTMSATADYRYDNIGLGLNLYNEKAGLIGRTRVVGTYAYHLKLNEYNRSLHFGLSLGAMNQKLDNPRIIADPTDVLPQYFNERRTYIDGDFGMAFINESFTLQGSLPNLKKFFQKDEENTIDGSTYFAAMSYKFGTDEDLFSLEPKIGVRGAKDIKNIIDFGSNLSLQDNILSFIGVYHTDKSCTLGVGVNSKKYNVNVFYTSQMGGKLQSTGADFEVNLKINVFNNYRR
jgi:type IX secretion system PorP/SprF family membrane protein